MAVSICGISFMMLLFLSELREFSTLQVTREAGPLAPSCSCNSFAAISVPYAGRILTQLSVDTSLGHTLPIRLNITLPALPCASESGGSSSSSPSSFFVPLRCV